jgi:hypothetical protein
MRDITTEEKSIDITRIQILETMVDREVSYLGVALDHGLKSWKVICHAVLEAGYETAAVHLWNKRN